jgi:hypothetical protein
LTAAEAPARSDAEWTVDTVRIAWTLIAIGVVLRGIQYAYNRSLWLDEAMIVLNIVQRPFAGLLKPLDFHQGAPIGFLLLEKAMTRVFGNTEHALRLYPQLSSIAVLPLTYCICRRLVSVRGALFALAVVAFSRSLIYYSAEVKQYSTDVFWGALLLLLTLRACQERRKGRELLALGAAGLVAIWMSHPAPFFLISACLILYFSNVRGKRDLSPWMLALFTASWLIVGLANYVLFLRPLSHESSLLDFWSNGFMPYSARAIGWLPKRLYDMLGDTMELPEIHLALFASLIGGYGLIRRSAQSFWLVICPVLAALLLAMAHRFPFGGRMLTYAIPLAAIAIGAGLDLIYISMMPRRRALGALVCVALLGPLAADAGLCAISPPGRGDMRGLLRKVARDYKPGDTIYVSGTDVYSYAFYSRYAATPIMPRDTVPMLLPFSPLSDRAVEEFCNEMRGRSRVWCLWSFPGPRGTEIDARLIQFHVDAHARRAEQLDAPGACGILYSFTTPPGPPNMTGLDSARGANPYLNGQLSAWEPR